MVVLSDVRGERRRVAARFSNPNARVEWSPAEDVFSAGEIALILRFAGIIGLDLGEIDVLRDRDGRIYVVDAAKTPHSPSDQFITLGGLTCMRLAAATFARQSLP